MNHIFSHINEWFFIKMLHRRPVIFTTIGEKCGLPLEHYKHIDVIVAETSFDYDHLRQYGFDDNKLRLIRPGVDSKKFFYKNAPISGKFRILFASTPPEPKDIEVKGIKVLLTLAKSMPSVEIVIAVRPWASAPFIKKMVQASGLSNVLLQTNIQDMNELYGSIHATIAPFLMSTKSAPLSILESLMAGKPVILSNHIEVMNELSSEHCAVVFDPLAEGSVLRAVKELIDNYVYFQQRSRPCADKYYSLDRFFKQYEDLYDEVLQGNRG
ncbi:MAG: glycosyltransferase [Candidatus Omnitrophica bacterium]|nr:glycosyltransferase [Candidatus Omnitrophota bacterium]